MNAVRISIYPAFSPAAGLIGVYLGRPPIVERTVYSAKLADIDAQLSELCEYATTQQPQMWCASVRVIDGRKPAGFDAAKAAGRFTRDGEGAV